MFKRHLPIILFFLSVFSSNAQQLDSLRRELPKMQDDTNKMNAIDKIMVYSFSSDIEIAKNYADTLMLFAKKINNNKGQGRAYHAIAQYYYYKGDWINMKKNLREAEDIFNKIGDDFSLYQVNLLYAAYYRDIGDIENALRISLKGLKYNREIKNKAGEAQSLVSVAFLLAQKARYTEAEDYYLQAAGIRNELGDKNGESMIFISLGALYTEQEMHDRALPYITKAWEIQQDLGNKLLIAHCEANMANIYNSKKQYQKALELANNAYQIYESQNNNQLLIIIHIYRSISYNGLKNFSLSIQELNEAKALIEANEVLKPSYIDLYLQYYTTYKESGDFRNALYYLELHNELEKENTTLEMQNNISQLKEQYEAEKKEEEINLLQEQNNTKDARLKARTYLTLALFLLIVMLILAGFFISRQSKLKQQKRTTELEHQALRAQMNPHFIFNALNSIQRVYVEGDTDKANDFMADFAQLMRKVLENSGLSSVSLQEELETLRLYLDLEKLRTKDCFSYSIEVDEDILNSGVQIPPLIIQPFAENAIWHGLMPLKDRKGELFIVFNRGDDGNILVKIEDNGVGFEKEIHAPKHNSKGIKITEQRIGSRVAVKSEKNKGTIVEFILKTT